MMSAFSVALATLLLGYSSATFSISYYNSNMDNKNMVDNAGLYLGNMPDATHVADLYTRLSGISPILNEADVNLPHLNMLTKQQALPIIVEITNQELPPETTLIATVSATSASAPSATAPNAKSVQEILSSNHVTASVLTFKGPTSEIKKWLSSQTAPLFIIHQMSPNVRDTQRKLGADDDSDSTSSSSSSVTPLTEFQISEYQICLWVGIMLTLLVLASICMVVNMEVVPDSLLYAKFQSSRTGKHD